ncbi:MAG: hypothetical protein Q9202_005519 [Teloschistes flavicans]
MQRSTCNTSCNPSNTLIAVPCQKYNNYHHHAETLKVNGFCNICAREDDGVSSLSRINPQPLGLQTRSGIDDLSDLFAPKPNRYEEKEIAMQRTSEVDDPKQTAMQYVPDKPQVMVKLPGMPVAVPSVRHHIPEDVANGAASITSVPSSMNDTQETEDSIISALEKTKKKRNPDSGHEQKRKERRANFRKAQAELFAEFKASGIMPVLPSQIEEENGSTSSSDSDGSSQPPTDLNAGISGERTDSPPEAQQETQASGASNEDNTSSMSSMPGEIGRAALSLPQIHGYLHEMDDQYTKLQNFTSKLREDASPQEAQTTSTAVDSASTSPSMAEVTLETFKPANLRLAMHRRSASSQVRQPLDAQIMCALLGIAKSNWLNVCETIMGSANQHDRIILDQMKNLVSCLGSEYNFPDIGKALCKDDGTITSNKSSDHHVPMEEQEIEKSHQSGLLGMLVDEPLGKANAQKGVAKEAVNGVIESAVEVADGSINDDKNGVSIQEGSEQLFARRERIASSLWILRKGQPIEASSGGYVSQYDLPHKKPDVDVPSFEGDTTSDITDHNPKESSKKEMGVNDEASQSTPSDDQSVIEETALHSTIKSCSVSVNSLEEDYTEGEPGVLNCRKKRNGDRAREWRAEGGKQKERRYDDQPTSIEATVDHTEPSDSSKDPNPHQQTASIMGTQQLDALIDAAFPKEEDTWAFINETKPLHSVEKIETKNPQPQKYVIPQKRWEMEQALVMKKEYESMSTLDNSSAPKDTALEAALSYNKFGRLLEETAPPLVRCEDYDASSERADSEHAESEPSSDSWQEKRPWEKKPPSVPFSQKMVQEQATSIKGMNEWATKSQREKRKEAAHEAALAAAEKHFLRMVEKRATAVARSEETDKSSWETESGHSVDVYHESHSVGAGVKEEEVKMEESPAVAITQTMNTNDDRVNKGKEKTDGKDEARAEALKANTEAEEVMEERSPSRFSSLVQRFSGFF